MSLFLLLFGFLTYYAVPVALINEKFGVFFFVMNFILTSLSIGMVMLAVISMHSFQKAILRCLLFCRRSDRKLAPIIENRLDAGRGRNTQIGIMITASIAFLII